MCLKSGSARRWRNDAQPDTGPLTSLYHSVRVRQTECQGLLDQYVLAGSGRCDGLRSVLAARGTKTHHAHLGMIEQIIEIQARNPEVRTDLLET